MSSFWSEGFLADMAALNMLSFDDTLTWYRQSKVSNGQGGDRVSLTVAGTGIPCRVDDEVNGPYPQRSKDNIDVDRIERTIYIPKTYAIAIGDQVSVVGGNPSGTAITYRVLDNTLETDETDIALLVEVVI
jgi:hypothetical protein